MVEVLARRNHVQYIVTHPPKPEDMATGNDATAALQEALEEVNEAMRDMSEAIGGSGNNATPRQHSRSAPVNGCPLGSLLACLLACSLACLLACLPNEGMFSQQD